MGEVEVQKEPEKSENKSGGGGVTVILKVDLHCEGCAQKVKKSLKHLNGVETVKTDFPNNKVTVIGKVKPMEVKTKVEEKTKKKVELLSPQPPPINKDKDKEADAHPKTAQKPDEKKPDEAKKVEQKPKEREVPVITVVLKTRVHCDGCAFKMKKIINKYPGVEDVSVDLSKDQISMKGTMDMKEMLPYLNAKLKRPVDVVPDNKAVEKKPNEGGDKKDKEEAKPVSDNKVDAKPADVAAPAPAPVVEENVGKKTVNKMEHYGYPNGYGSQMYNPQQPHQNGYVAEYWHAPQQYMHAPQHYYGHAPPQYEAGPSTYAPQMFSDENPNACSIM